LDVELRVAAEEMHALADAARDLELEALGLDVDAAIVGKPRLFVEARVLGVVVLLGAEQRQRAQQAAVEELALDAHLVALADRGAERRQEIGRASCRESVEVSVVAAAFARTGPRDTAAE